MADLIQLVVFVLLVTLFAVPLGGYMARVFGDGPAPGDRFFLPLERAIYRLIGVDPQARMTWRRYATALVVTNFFMMALMYLVLRLQKYLPLNPDGIAAMPPSLAYNTVTSFITNTNWQAYSGETAMSYLGQMLAITYPMFTSAATGIVAAIAFLRALTGVRQDLGNFFVDLVRAHTRLLLPLAFLVALVLVAEGAPQTFQGAAHATTFDGKTQVIPRGPVASLESIKHLGTNGGGYFGANAAHPFENPSPITNLIHMLSMMLIPTSLMFTFGRMIGNRRQAWVLYTAVFLLFLGMWGIVYASEQAGVPAFDAAGITGGNMEGKEVRFGIFGSALFTTVTTAATTGSVDNMHDSLTPLGGFVPMAQMMLNNVFGGVGAGLLNILLYVIMGVFLTGLMVGRTPELFGKKIETKEVKLASVALLVHPLIILAPTATALLLPDATASILNPGSHGLSEVLYAYTSGAANNGSAFAGLDADTVFYNTTIGSVMLLGRFVSIIALLGVAGSLARKTPVSAGAGALRTDTPLFGAVYLIVVLLIGALAFFPALAVGPIAEQLSMWFGA
ncbi:MAG: potassium-transporting ATPase subunit KdpA [Hydrogenibacillus sp.]|nr:potassium-transporting ATPase subunit KdpA [Hydrogenibacillus sp.]